MFTGVDGSTALVVCNGNGETSVADDSQGDVIQWLGKGGGASRMTDLAANSSCVTVSDDGDVFIGGGVIPGKYPQGQHSWHLKVKGEELTPTHTAS